MKKTIAAVIVVITLCLVGCSKGNTTNTPSPEVTATPVVTTEPVVQKNEYKTENIKITTAEEALARLKEGNQRFVNNESELINVTGERREQLQEGQSPYVVVVSCSDSRVTPTTVFNAGLGEIFDIRIAGNVVDADAMGSIEYGIEHLNAPLLVIMGHEKCGAVTAAYDKLTKGTEPTGNVKSIVDKIDPAIKDAKDLNEAIQDNIDAVTDQVEENEVVKHLVEQGKLKVVEAYYSLDGSVTFETVD